MGLAVQVSNKICGKCLHFISPSDRCDKTNGICYYGATPCQSFERPYPSCGNCKHFLDGGEWNLCCDIKKDLVFESMEACEQYERI